MSRSIGIGSGGQQQVRFAKDLTNASPPLRCLSIWHILCRKICASSDLSVRGWRSLPFYMSHVHDDLNTLHVVTQGSAQFEYQLLSTGSLFTVRAWAEPCTHTCSFELVVRSQPPSSRLNLKEKCNTATSLRRGNPSFVFSWSQGWLWLRIFASVRPHTGFQGFGICWIRTSISESQACTLLRRI